MTRRRALAGLAGAIGSGAVVACGSSSDKASTTTQPQVKSVTTTTELRAPDSRPFPARPEGAESIPQIEHIIIYMQENHSYDSYLGMLGRGDGYTMKGGKPTNTNPDLSGKPVPLFHMTSPCDVTNGASQSWNATHISVDGGAMDGFVKAAQGGTGSMGYWDGTDLPFYYGLAKTFPLCDRWFCSAPCQTFPNRRFLQAATSVGIVSTDIAEVLATPDAPNGLIWDRLNAHGITWNDYVIDLADILLFPNFYAKNGARVKHFGDFLHDCQAGTLPQVSVVSPGNKTYTEESPSDIQLGESYSSIIVNAVMQSPLWEKTAMFFTYDEHGGYYDHVPPPAAVPPDNIAPRTKPGDQPGGFDRYGPRVPGFVISPYAKKGYVSHVVHDHTSILKFVETKFNLGALTARDANADDLLDCFDFTAMDFREPPTLPAPGLPATGSACQSPPVPLPSTIKPT